MSHAAKHIVDVLEFETPVVACNLVVHVPPNPFELVSFARVIADHVDREVPFGVSG